jgi:hypothetical protein
MKKTILAFCAITALAGAASAQSGSMPISTGSSTTTTQGTTSISTVTGSTTAPYLMGPYSTVEHPDTTLDPMVTQPATGLPTSSRLHLYDVSNTSNTLDNPATIIDESQPLQNSSTTIERTRTEMNSTTDPLAPPVNDQSLPTPGTQQSDPSSLDHPLP